MTNEEKANEIARDILPYNNAEYHACYNSAMKAMQWKDEKHEQEKQQLIDEAAKWIRIHKYMYENEYVMADDFKKAMKGE